MQIETLSDDLQQLKNEAQDQAIRRYSNNEDNIDQIRKGLRLVREGFLPLINLDDDPNRTKQRIARENAPVRIAQERINGTNDFVEAAIVDRLAQLKTAVCRISLNGKGIGTGFLVAEGVILTNHHVIPDAETAQLMTADFGYETRFDKKLKQYLTVRIRPELFFYSSPLHRVEGEYFSGLDFTFVAIEEHDLIGNKKSSEYHVAALDGTLGKIITGEQCVTIQHPTGEPKKIVLKDISLLKLTERHIIYESDTLPGSSGSMVIGLGTGEIIGLHHASIPKRDNDGNIRTKSGAIATSSTPDEQIAWEGNEGIRISCILEALEKAQLPEPMNAFREAVLNRTQKIKAGSATEDRSAATVTDTTSQSNSSHMPINAPSPVAQVFFTLLLSNTPENITVVNRFLSTRYGREIAVQLMTPYTAREGENELFEFTTNIVGNPSDEAAQLLRFPFIMAAESDEPMYLNTSDNKQAKGNGFDGTTAYESAIKEKIWEDEFSIWNEPEFIKRWKGRSNYVDEAQLGSTRRWNHVATKFDQVTMDEYELLAAANITIAQLDTGYTRHSKVDDGFDFERDYDAVANDEDAEDELTNGILKFPGHGTRTGSLLIGRRLLDDPGDPYPSAYHEGNWGLLRDGKTKIVPYRVAKTVILLNRQQELAKAVDRAIASGAQVMTMSMGTAPTITTARLAKKAYDAGVIWCSAAGNEVKFVIAPAVFPGVIAVAASNPGNAAWRGSSLGDAVDITAPGEDVYVPILSKDGKGKTIEDYAYGDGTSYATPHIAAAAALWLAKHKDKLREKAGHGEAWKKIEAFRFVLKETARKDDHSLPEGFGAGILNVRALLSYDFDDIKWDELEYAYNGWNEHAFLAALQGWVELAKTYWNIVHKKVSSWLGWESTVSDLTSGSTLSTYARDQEALLFGRGSTLENAGPVSADEALGRLQQINQLIFQSARK